MNNYRHRMGNAHTLPDSRLKNPVDTVMVNWEWEEYRVHRGQVQKRVVRHRLELEPIFCFQCGKRKGYVPRGLFSWVSMLCDPCSEALGGTPLELDHPDAEFWAKVSEEMERTYGRALTQTELDMLAERGELSRGLQLLERECPLPSKNHRPKGLP